MYIYIYVCIRLYTACETDRACASVHLDCVMGVRSKRCWARPVDIASVKNVVSFPNTRLIVVIMSLAADMVRINPTAWSPAWRSVWSVLHPLWSRPNVMLIRSTCFLFIASCKICVCRLICPLLLLQLPLVWIKFVRICFIRCWRSCSFFTPTLLHIWMCFGPGCLRIRWCTVCAICQEAFEIVQRLACFGHCCTQTVQTRTQLF